MMFWKLTHLDTEFENNFEKKKLKFCVEHISFLTNWLDNIEQN